MIRLDNNGDVVAGSAVQLTEWGPYTELIAGIGGPYLLVGTKWPTDGSACSQSIVGRLVTGSVVSNPFVIHDAGGADIANFAATADGNGFQLVWMKRLGSNVCPPLSQPDPPGTYYPSPSFGLTQIHVGQDGSSGTPSTVAEGSGLDQQPSVARNSAAEVLVWIETAYSGNSSKIAAAIAHPGQPLVMIPIASSAASQIYSGIAAAENTFMTVWSEQSPLDLTTAVYARRFSTDGRALDAAPIKVSDDQSYSYPAPVVSFDGAIWMFLWGSGPRASVRRMAANGTWIDPAPILIGPSDRVFDYAVASNGNGFAVLTFEVGPAFHLTLIPRTGEARQLPVTVPGLTGYPMPLSMAWDGNAYVAVWREPYTGYIEGIRFDQGGQLLSPLFSVDRTSRFDDMPSIACHEKECTVAWQADDSIAVASMIGTTIILFNRLIGPTAPNTHASRPTLLGIPDGYQLFWKEQGSASSSLFTSSITAAGIDSPSLLGPDGPFLSIAAAVTTRGQPGLMLVHPAYDPAFGGVERAFLRVWPAPEQGRRRAAGR